MKKPRQSKVRNSASIVNGALYFEDVCQCKLEDEIAAEILDDAYLTAIRVVSLTHNWQERVYYTADTNLVEDINVEMTLRKEKRGLLYHWYAYRRCLGKLHKRYVGHSEQISQQRLLEIARALPSV